jgi:hypothetical protein
MSLGTGHARTLSVLVLSQLSEQLDRPMMAALTRELAPLERQGHHLVVERGELDPRPATPTPCCRSSSGWPAGIGTWSSVPQ